MKSFVFGLILFAFANSALAGSSPKGFDCGDIFWGFNIKTDGGSALGYVQSGYGGIRLEDCMITSSTITCSGNSKAVGEEGDYHQISIRRADDGSVNGKWISLHEGKSKSEHTFNSCRVW